MVVYQEYERSYTCLEAAGGLPAGLLTPADWRLVKRLCLFITSLETAELRGRVGRIRVIYSGWSRVQITFRRLISRGLLPKVSRLSVEWILPPLPWVPGDIPRAAKPPGA